MKNKLTMEINERVGAVSSLKDGEIELFGYGIYEGKKIPDSDDIKFMGHPLKELKLSNPCILLDSGERVWGCECWWGSEVKVKEMEKSCKKVNIISPKQIRIVDEK